MEMRLRGDRTSGRRELAGGVQGWHNMNKKSKGRRTCLNEAYSLVRPKQSRCLRASVNVVLVALFEQVQGNELR